MHFRCTASGEGHSKASFASFPRRSLSSLQLRVATAKEDLVDWKGRQGPWGGKRFTFRPSARPAFHRGLVSRMTLHKGFMLRSKSRSDLGLENIGSHLNQPLFTCGGARRSISGTFSFLLLKTSQNSSLKASNIETAQCRDV